MFTPCGAPPPPPPPAKVCSLTSINLKNISGAVLMVPQEPTNHSKEHLRRNIKATIEKDIPNLSSKIIVSSNNIVHPILQDGPCCGVVALAMAAQMLKKEMAATQILEFSQKKGLSLQGELFSAYDMAKLAEEILDCTATVLDMKDSGSRKSLLGHIANNHPVLVPYDGDKNNGPCLKNGNKAHWAVLTGFLFSLERTLLPDDVGMVEDAELSPLYEIQPEEAFTLQNFLVSSPEVFVYGMQGKSQNIGVWSLDKVLESNANLREVDPNREAEVEQYIIPQEGIQMVLCNKVVILCNQNLNSS
ncbi:actin maturation protease-like [Saccostrea echinata]|uniref:actin maturation protease-like n=1 Tax=Saccostrea echinata TaxID=191078 RepID=UPI002A7F88F1|nr:actin maturation protease-like [Saccostrea echinata]